ncbi:helix-turn-helix domain-containing protein [Bradyrhizobium sp. WSM3983]|uniref:helix-turn-helix domain-containing protein n=1 Tax=Bradyrhizobium sp. WSM3983 TaxID=1038867 RepID=UPI00041DE763|nr:helix-turn-helix domain-containing protein [Bradyrhizobium sp. WSM3983]
MVGKRHASGEIAAKLAQANDLALRGKTQREISKALGVSIMTYHRWKKMEPVAGPPELGGNSLSRGQPGAVDADAGAIKRLELENAQLRRLVTDMLLEKLKLEDALGARQEARLRRPDNG